MRETWWKNEFEDEIDFNLVKKFDEPGVKIVLHDATKFELQFCDASQRQIVFDNVSKLQLLNTYCRNDAAEHNRCLSFVSTSRSTLWFCDWSCFWNVIAKLGYNFVNSWKGQKIKKK